MPLDVKHICPADGWFAVFFKEGRPTFVPVALWVIFDDNTVGGFTGGEPDWEGFQRYMHKDDIERKKSHLEHEAKNVSAG